MALLRNVMAIAAGGALGALCRFGCSLWLANQLGTRLPYGTLAVNVIGAFGIGLAATFFSMKYGTTHYIALFIITGFLGALTTFSTFSLETLTLMLNQQIIAAALNVILNCILCLFAAYLGMQLVKCWY